MKIHFAFLLLTLAFTSQAYSSNYYNDSLIVGTWRGTSICQIKSSPCHDEIAAYHALPGNKPGVYHFIMNKMVNGVEEEMGETDFVFNEKDHTLTWVDEKRNAIWKFTIKDKVIDGTLMVKGELYRVIHLEKDAKKKP